MRLLLIFALFVIPYLFPVHVLSQRSRTIDTATTWGCYRQQVIPISYAPPLKTDMSLNALIGYIYLDSLMRGLTSEAQLDSFYRKISNYDTLKYFNKYLYAMSEYDAILLEEYGLAGYAINSLYKGVPGAIIETLKQKAYEIIPDSLLLRYLINCSIIVHIKVNSITNDADSFGYVPVHPIPMRCINAEIMDTIKGKHILTGDCASSLTRHNMTTQSINPCILFSYSPVWKKNTSDFVNIGESEDMSGDGDSTVAVGKEYIVFLHSMFFDYDGTHSFYNYWPSSGLKLQSGIFPILSNGNIVDSGNLAGLGPTPSLTAFKAKLRSEITRILHAE